VRKFIFVHILIANTSSRLVKIPLVSVGGKGPPGPSNVKGWSCGKCEKVLSRKDALREHCLRKHKWCIDSNAEATPDVLEASYKKTRKMGVGN